jgi:photosystem II stability/assembly factor-like uncharacterized protein
MKKILLILILIQFSLFSQWQELQSPKSIQALRNINTGSDFIVGSLFDPYFSFDGGETWEKRTNGLPDERGPIEKIIVEDDVVYILINTIINIRDQYIMYSTDNGLNWLKLIDGLHANKYNVILDFKVIKNKVYLLTMEDIIIKSENFGSTWDTLPRWDKKIGYMSLIDVKNDSIVIASKGGIAFDGGTVKASYLVSIDGGNTWEQRSNQLSTKGLKRLKIHNHNIYIGSEDGFFYSEDFGQSWRSPGMLVVGANVRDFAVVNDTVFLATENGLYRAIDLFKGWEEIVFFKTKRVWEIHYGFEKLFVRSFNRDYSEHKTYVSEGNNTLEYSIFNFTAESTLNSFYIDYPKIFFTTEKLYFKENIYSEKVSLFETDTTFELVNISVYENNIICEYLYTNSIPSNNVFNFSNNNGNTWYKTDFILDSNINSISTPFLLNNDTLLLIGSPENIYISVGFKKEIKKLKTEILEIDNLLSKVKNIIRNKNKIYYFGPGVILESDTNLTNWKSYSNNLNSNYILNLSKSNNFIYTIHHKGNLIEPSTVKISVSKDEGNSWRDINNLFPNYENTRFRNVFAIEDYVFVSSSNGVYFSKDDGETFEELNDGLSTLAKANGGEFHLYGDKILFCSSRGIFHRDLEELGITLSVQKTETRNYLWTNPPYPQPTNSIVKVETYWDSGLPFSEKDIEIYDLTGIKINIENTLSIQKESIYKGHIIWDASSYKTGIYIMKITHGTETRVRKIMVVE